MSTRMSRGWNFIFFPQVLEEIKVKREMDRDTLINVAKTSLRTKVHAKLADILTEVGTIELFKKLEATTKLARYNKMYTGCKTKTRSKFDAL